MFLLFIVIQYVKIHPVITTANNTIDKPNRAPRIIEVCPSVVVNCPIPLKVAG